MRHSPTSLAVPGKPKAGAWQTEGRRIDVVYRGFDPEIPLGAFVDELVPLLPARNSPITKQKTGVQGYLFAIPPKAGQLLCERLEFVVPARGYPKLLEFVG